MCPDSMLRRSAAWSTTKPRDRFRNSDRGRIAANSASPKKPRLPARPSTCRVTVSTDLQQLVQGGAAPRVAERELVGGVVEVHGHAEVLGQHRQLGADVAVADDAQLAAAHLVAARPRTCPTCPACICAFFSVSRRAMRDDLGQRQLDHAAGVGERRVEHRDAAPARRGQVDLVGADAEGADRHQIRGRGQHALGDLGLGPDAEQVHAGDAPRSARPRPSARASVSTW